MQAECEAAHPAGRPLPEASPDLAMNIPVLSNLLCIYAVAPDLLLQGAGIWEVAFGQAEAQAADSDGGRLPVAGPDLPSIPGICERAKASEDQDAIRDD